ncbi:asparagine synthase (glutamine-hydrolyzing) [Methylobacterium mesophilicum]
MCGIAGYFGKANPEAVERMLSCMLHRGPDDGGLYTDENISIGQRRLAIIDRSSGGHQPMPSADGRIQVVFNGEIYNFRAERDRLAQGGRRFLSDSDTEVVLALYEKHGDAFVERLRGMFAIAIYDRRGGPGRERLLLARDQFGIKPLLYAQKADGIAFASELKALIASGCVERQIDPGGLRQLLSLGSIYQPNTLVSGVRNLPPAHMMVVDRSGCRVSRYWGFAPDRIKGLRTAPYVEQVERLHEVLRESVKLQMVADVSVGAFLSGGVDSSLIVALMTRETGRAVKTFSVGFESGTSAIDETSEAAEIAVHLGTDHQRVVVTSADIVAHLDRFICGLDQPSVDGLNSYFVAGAAAQAVTVSLSGTGSDEIFLGYPWFAHVANRFGGDPLTWPAESRGARLWRRLSRTPAVPREDRSEEFENAFGGLYHCFGPDMADALLSPQWRADAPKIPFHLDLAPSDELRYASPLDRAGVLCLNGYTRNQLLRDIDACAMAHSLEVRVPFLDPVVSDYALSLPTESKMKLSDATLDPQAGYAESGVKRVVCDVARHYLPASFFEQRAKKGFNLPHADWLRGPLAETMAEALSPATVARRGIFDPEAVDTVRKDFLEGRRPWSHPWILMVTELWCRQVLMA